MAFFVFILGLFIGSFLNVLADRLPRNETILGRSHCDKCKKTLAWVDLIPLLSFIYLRGKCRYCFSKISIQYPVVELITGILFAFTIYYLPITNSIANYLVSSIYYLIIVSALIVIFFADLRHGIIPDKIVFPAIGLSLVWIATSNQQLAFSYLLSGLGAGLFFFIIYLLTRGRGMGFGDVKFAFFIGFFLGFPAIIFALYIAFLTGAACGFILILWGKKKLKTAIPFGPFLVLGCFGSLFLQNLILQIILPYL